jgi:hypothetical protein
VVSKFIPAPASAIQPNLSPRSLYARSLNSTIGNQSITGQSQTILQTVERDKPDRLVAMKAKGYSAAKIDRPRYVMTVTEVFKDLSWGIYTPENLGVIVLESFIFEDEQRLSFALRDILLNRLNGTSALVLSLIHI